MGKALSGELSCPCEGQNIFWMIITYEPGLYVCVCVGGGGGGAGGTKKGN